MQKYIFAFILPLAVFALPATSHAATFADLVNKSIVPLGNTIIGLLYALALIVFLIGMVRLFFSDSEEQRQKGRYFAFWGIIGLVVLFAAWGLVRIGLSIISDIGS